ncbi:hypothetical protein HMPREF3185_01637 [Porphyromonas somerae]|uniref:Uncharacterized protein n=1 Tax=Porphyromonas somerae TaxID=322095 RepID=A0A134B3X8_9PORP|nr:hypothetical protein HMPREF3184_01637 [Porphyromonadaceae bacterium KA00676]KXB74644.1 hypothetical protein HMPREF3185_01637 [Porphyromonas somerae]
MWSSLLPLECFFLPLIAPSLLALMRYAPIRLLIYSICRGGAPCRGGFSLNTGVLSLSPWRDVAS